MPGLPTVASITKPRRPAGLRLGVALALAATVAQAAASGFPQRRAGLWEVRAVGAEAAGLPEPARAGAGEGTGVDHLADLVVLGALLGVGQHRVGLAGLLEARLGGGVPRLDVRVVLAGDPAVRLRDLLLRGRLGHAQDLVVVLLEVVPLAHPALSCVTAPP